MKCPKCLTEILDDSRFCSKCGTPIVPSEKASASFTKTMQAPVHEIIQGKLLASKYKILEEIGRGGMGIVYKAEDISLARKVAVKVLPETFTGDLERLARFEREAKLLASLNHSNIATIHGLEEADGKRFLVMELLEGDTLAERISRGPLPLEQTLKVCLQIAEGVEAAHEKGIIHRDLKPSNVKITPDGKVKVLDFGLAKAFFEEKAASDLSKSPTITEQMTEAGVILGTAAYMSPEQAKGKAVDKRTDIWAFGCILYECLSGKRAFMGETVTDMLVAILMGEPAWDALPEPLPWKVKGLLNRCLQKDAKERIHDIADARIEIADALSQPLLFELAPLGKARIIWKAIALGLGVLVFGLTSAFIGLLLKKPPTTPIVKTTIDLPEGTQLLKLAKNSVPSETELALSPDGRYVAFSAGPEGLRANAKLYLRAMDSSEARLIAEGARCPFFSPDGLWIGFWGQGKLQKVSASGGIPIPLCDVDPPLGTSWGLNGRIIIGTLDKGLRSFDAGGGKPEGLTTLDTAKEASHRLPYFLPGAKAVLFTVMPHIFGTRSHIEILSLESGKRKVLIDEGADARYVPTGHLVYMREGTLMARPFNLDRMEFNGAAVPVVKGVMQAFNHTYELANSGAGQFSFSNSGSFAYVSGGILPDFEEQLVWIDRQGKMEPMGSIDKKAYFSPRISPDGQKVAFSTLGMNADVWVCDFIRSTLTKLTSDGRSNFLCWTPDGTRITFDYSTAGIFNLFWMPWDSSGPIESLTISSISQSPGSWSPDGRFLAYVEGLHGSDSNIFIFRKDDQKSVPFISMNFNEGFPEFSPDGRWLAYASDESGRQEVYVTEFPGPGKKIMISNRGGSAPLWARNGREFYYFNLDYNKLMVADIINQPTFKASIPRMLFEVRAKLMKVDPLRNYDISPDGRRFLVVEFQDIKPVEVTRLNFVQNWFDELKRLAPAEKK